MRVVRRCQKYHSRLWVRAGRFPSTGELYSQTSVDIACAMAVCRFNDVTLSLQSIAHRLELETSPFCGQVLRRKDKRRVQGSQYKATEAAKKLRKRARRKRKGLQDKEHEKEGPMYAPGAFDNEQPGPSKRPRGK